MIKNKNLDYNTKSQIYEYWFDQKDEGDNLVGEAETAGKAFIDSLKAADKDVKVSESGLAYKVITMGNGAVAKEADKVSVVYTGKLIDGSEFDSSKGEAVKFSPRQVVAGFGEALTTFPVGTKVILYIPENLGYGKRASGKIAPGSTLVFDLEIKDIEVKKEESAE